jgi:hypothetical protein
MKPLKVCLAALLFLTSCKQEQPTRTAAQSFYIDCGSGNDQAAGTSPAQAWRTAGRLNQQFLQPGDQVFFRRGTRCSGMIQPKGSGTPESPIRLSAYGEGPLPVIEANGADYVFRLNNQHGWEVSLLDLRGGALSGISAGCDDGDVHDHIRFENLAVSGLRGYAITKRRGLVAVAPTSHRCTFSNVSINGISAFDSTQWSGIVVDGGFPPSRPEEMDSRWQRWFYRVYRPQHKTARNVAITNSLVHDVGGDGIVIFRAQNATIESNVVWNAGTLERPNNLGQSPNAMWTLLCRSCAIRDNEAFLTDTPIVDGGAFDIDWGCDDNIIEYNFAHENSGYCFSIFGARNITTTNSTARYNICLNNGRGPRMAIRQGDLFLSTWDGGALDGMEIYSNTFIWNPSAEARLFQIRDAHQAHRITFRGNGPKSIRNNVFISSVPKIGEIDPAIETKNNQFWSPGAPDQPRLDPLLRPFTHGMSSSGQQASASSSDAFYNPVPKGSPAFSGALMPAGSPLPKASAGPKTLRVYLDPAHPFSRRNILLVRSAARQFAPLGLRIEIRLSAAASRNLPYDWHFNDLPHSFESKPTAAPAFELADAGSASLISWRDRPSHAELNLALRWYVGPPRFAPSFDFAYEK